MIKKYRRLIQIIVFVGMFIIPLLNILEITFIKGTFYSIDIGDVAMADPFAIFQAFLVSRGISFGMVVSVVIPILIMLILGRVWCSWMCPYYLITEFIEYLRKKLRLKLNRPKYHKTLPDKTNFVRFIFLIIGTIVAGISGIPLLNLISAPGVISSQALVLIKFHYITFEIFFILLLLILEFFYFRFWCRFFCPQGAFLSIFRVKNGLRVEKMVDNCSNCLSCIRSCPMILNPMEDGLNPLCNNCGDCVDACPDNKKIETLKFRM
ncbi:MAG: 4Fe-4S binding protein [Calditerrivibrio sp.]|nr:4Fe-4S binding protein [Calditerrivibrio sp.]MCA1980803.1 4Fe-4S binding protein [Calditerrivibrio sp.]